MFSLEGTSHTHISQYLKFQEIFEFVGHHTVALSIFSEPPTQRKPCAYLVANIILGSVATQLRWVGIMHAFRSYDFPDSVCQKLWTSVPKFVVADEKLDNVFWDTWYNYHRSRKYLCCQLVSWSYLSLIKRSKEKFYQKIAVHCMKNMFGHISNNINVTLIVICASVAKLKLWDLDAEWICKLWSMIVKRSKRWFMKTVLSIND